MQGVPEACGKACRTVANAAATARQLGSLSPSPCRRRETSTMKACSSAEGTAGFRCFARPHHSRLQSGAGGGTAAWTCAKPAAFRCRMARATNDAISASAMAGSGAAGGSAAAAAAGVRVVGKGGWGRRRMRRVSWKEARAIRRKNGGRIYVCSFVERVIS